MKMRYFVLQILICLTFFCGQTLANAPYRLGFGDIVSLTVYGEKDLSGDYKIAETGMVSIPLIGEVFLKNLTTSEAEILVTGKLADGYLVNPSVSIAVVQHRPFYILGEVAKPGSYSYTSDMNVLNAVALAGGFTYRANRKIVEIMPAGKTPDSYREAPIQASVQPGDTILVKERFF